MNVFERFRGAWRTFRGRDHPRGDPSGGAFWGNGSNVTQFMPGYGQGIRWGEGYAGPTSADRPDRLRLKPGNEKTLINAVYNRIALDVADVEMYHARVDENGRFTEVVPGSLEEALTLEANIDQTSQAYTVDLVMSMFDEGVVAEVPVECDRKEDGEITDKMPLQLRLGKVTEWRPHEVRVNLYNELNGQKEDVNLPKREVSIIENPFYSVMNTKNSVFQRLTRKLAILDVVDEKQGSDKLNMILQLPYIVRGDLKKKEAKIRLTELEQQLGESKYGISYVDGTEKIIQLNRPLENTLQKQIEWLTELFFSQLCITKEILNGTADEKTMTNYMNRTVGVICGAIAAERRRKFLTREQRKRNETILFNQNPFKLVPVTLIADIADKLTRNAVLSPNEVRGIIGYKPSDDETADQLVNRNMPMNQTPEGAEGEEAPPEGKPNRAERRRMERSKVPRGN